jgi:WD40 repeat protein
LVLAFGVFRFESESTLRPGSANAQPLATLGLKEFNMKKTLQIKLSFIFLVLLIACTPVTPPVSIAVSETEPSATFTAVNTPQPTATVVTATPSPTPLPQVKTQCAASDQESPPLELGGVIVLAKTGHQLDFSPGFYLMNADTQHIFYTDNLSIVERVAPDGKHLVYNYDTPSGVKEYMRVMDSNGKLIAEFEPYYDLLWASYFSWQNEQQIRIVTKNLNEVYVQLVNPFTQELTLLKTDWEEAYRPADPFKDPVANWKFDRLATDRDYVYGANILYDPTLTRVIFPKEGGYVALVDVRSGKELAHMNFVDWGSLPSWSPDGKYLTIVNREGVVDNFYLVYPDGNKFESITDFASEFDFVSIPEYIWSPDSQRIAFWLKLENEEQQDGAQSELAVLDIPSKQVTRFCIQGISSIAYEPLSMNHPEPVWSPDGRYLMITQWDDPAAPKKYYVFVVDIEKGSVERISENTAPIGWMTNDQ